jgi:hypothetical protein
MDALDPGLPVVLIKQCSVRLQELCAYPSLSDKEVLEIANISKTIVRESSKILIWAERVVK